MSLTNYLTLGRSGLRVSPLCLGTMTFGTESGWGAVEDVSRALFNRYIDAGGNFIDTANAYTNGTSETMLGKFIEERGLRDQVVLATKFTINTSRTADRKNPNAGGNGRKNIYQALEASLRRLKTDYIDLYWLHMWDSITPIEEVISTLNDLVRAGRIRHYGLSDVPAWYAARAQTLAEQEGKERIVALQLEYSLIERNIEREHVPMAAELGMGLCPWSPLASGFLSGKYNRSGGSDPTGRLELSKQNSMFDRFTERNWNILDTLLEIANALGKTPSQVALNWAVHQPAVASVIIGATKMAQLDDNLTALDFDIPQELKTRLDEASAPELIYPYTFFHSPRFVKSFTGGIPQRRWTPGL